MRLSRRHRRDDPEESPVTLVKDLVAAAAAENPPKAEPSQAPPSRAAELPSGWQPIVVDRPVAEFAPRPPKGHSYRPDCLVDGWSTDHVDVRLAAVRGYSHRYYGEPRQDDAAVTFHEPTGSVVFAVADGVSNARLPEIGAQLACRAAIGFLSRRLGVGQIDWSHLADTVAGRLVEHARRPERRPGERPPTPEDFATTLVTGFVAPTVDGPVATMIQIGDSGAWLLADGEFRDVLTPKSSPGATVVNSAVTALPALPEVVSPVRVPLSPGAVLLVGTDGIGDPLGDGSGMVGDLFRTMLGDPPPLLRFAHVVDFSRETFDDDRTLLAIWPRSPARPGQRL